MIKQHVLGFLWPPAASKYDAPDQQRHSFLVWENPWLNRTGATATARSKRTAVVRRAYSLRSQPDHPAP